MTTLRPTNVAILGATGTIGRNALEVIAGSAGRLRVVGMAANRRCGLLAELAAGLEVAKNEHSAANPAPVGAKGSTAATQQTANATHQIAAASHPSATATHSGVANCPTPTLRLVMADSAAASGHDWSSLPANVELSMGPDALDALVRRPEVDVVVAAIVGSAGLASTCAALEAGKRVALANKEALVMAGPLVMRLAGDGAIVPVDSEHSAIFQALAAGSPREVERMILTASGGPFRRHTAKQLAEVTVADALRHPTWDMGPKITIDSATMMNKALEIIEARWLFGLRPEQIAVMIHPQSIVHSMVEFVDGSVMAQLSPPDMKLPIQYALDYPARRPGVAARMDWSRSYALEFEPPDLERFPALALGMEVAAAGGTAGAVVNAANERAVAGFLAGELRFLDIVPACRRVLEHHDFEPDPSLARLIELDAWARREVVRWACAS